MSDYLKRLNAAIDQAEQMARAATPGPWVAKGDYPQTVHSPNYSLSAADEDIWVISTAVTLHAEADAVYIAANDPATRLRNIAEDRGRLAEHALVTLSGIAVCEHGQRVYVPWPCPEVLSVGRRYGITPEEAS